MIQNRIDGFIALHSLTLCSTLYVSFFANLLVFRLTNVVILNPGANFALYSVGLLIAALSIHRHLRGAARRYGRFTNRENARLSVHQVMRVTLVLFAIAFVTKDREVSRIFIVSFIALVAVAFLLVNIFLPRALAAIFLRHSIQRTAIAASGSEVGRLHEWLDRYSEIGVRLVGYISVKPSKRENSCRWLGEIGEIEDLVRRESIDQILIDQTDFSPARARQIIDQCERMGCRVRSFINIATLLPSPNAAFEQDGHYAFATITPEPLDNPLNQMSKRIVDIVISIPVIVFALPVILGITIVFQRLQSRGPILYRQVRTGINGRRFVIFKIRTMHPTDGCNDAQQASRHDCRIYPFGRFLRRTSLDEMPQFLNVLRGEMSVSGPRPHLIEHDELFARIISAYRKRHFVKPGITGLAQSKGCRGEIARPSAIMRRVRYDMHYVAKWSLLMDLRIIANTIRQILFPPPSAF